MEIPKKVLKTLKRDRNPVEYWAISALNKKIPTQEEAKNLNKAITLIDHSHYVESNYCHKIFPFLGTFSWEHCKDRAKYFTRMVDAGMKNKTD